VFKATGKFDVCLSYAGDQGEKYVQSVREELEKLKLKVFDYQTLDAKGELTGENLYEKIDNIYRERSAVCVIFVSKSYLDRYWTRRELEAVKTHAWTKEHDYLVPVRCDDAELLGMPPWIVYEDLRPGKTTPEQLAGLINHKVKKLRRKRLLRLLWPVAAALLLIAAVAAYLLRNPSLTLDHVDPEKITVHVNNGWRPVELADFRLKFHKLPIEDAILRKPGAEWGVERLSPFDHPDVVLRPTQLLTKCSQETLSRPPFSEIQFKSDSSVTLEIDVYKSGSRSEKIEVWSQTLPAKDVPLFLKGKVADYEYPCTAPAGS
jgi:hypothetical protein